MRTRLSFEIFGAFLAASLILVILTVAGLRFFFYEGFREYVHKRNLEKLPYAGRLLEEAYARERDWSRLQADPDAWYELLETAQELHWAESGSDSTEKRERGRKAAKKRRLSKRYFLLDEDRRPLIGKRAEEEEGSLLELRVQGETVGWLGLRVRTLSWSPLEKAFLEQQYRVFSFLGGGVFVLALLLTFFLARRLLVPVRALMQGTRALASRRFDTRILIRSGNELGQLAEDFNRMAETLEAYETLRRDWISDISHELRTPLSILQGEVQALQDGVRRLDPAALDSLQAEVDRLTRLVEALHLLSLADSEALAMRRDPIDPVSVLKQQVETFREPMSRAGIALRYTAEDMGSARLMGDADHLGRVFSNLLQNTLQYTDRPGTLDIRAAKREGRLEVVFEDSAPGVPGEALGRLFERLYRVDKSRSRALGGSGLGLSIARRIVEAHGGGMSADRSGEGGLKVTVLLPLQQEGTG